MQSLLAFSYLVNNNTFIIHAIINITKKENEISKEEGQLFWRNSVLCVTKHKIEFVYQSKNDYDRGSCAKSSVCRSLKHDFQQHFSFRIKATLMLDPFCRGIKCLPHFRMLSLFEQA